MQVKCLGRAPRTKESLPDFLKWCRVTRHPLVFCGLTGSQRTPGNGASQSGHAEGVQSAECRYSVEVLQVKSLSPCLKDDSTPSVCNIRNLNEKK